MRLAIVAATFCLGCSFVESFDGYTSNPEPSDATDAQVGTVDVPAIDTFVAHDTTPAPDTFVADSSVVDTFVAETPVDTPPPCTLTTCAGACVDTDSDPMNCGGCGNVVDASMYCVGGAPTCRPNTGPCTRWTYDGTDYVECEYACTDHLGDGSHCVSATDPTHIYRCYLGSTVDGYCVDGACTSAGCPGTLTTCASTLSNVWSCFDTRRDSNHCGTCGKRCAANETCAAGGCAAYRVVSSCGACGSGEKCCTAQTGWAYSTFCIQGASCPDD